MLSVNVKIAFPLTMYILYWRSFSSPLSNDSQTIYDTISTKRQAVRHICSDVCLCVNMVKRELGGNHVCYIPCVLIILYTLWHISCIIWNQGCTVFMWYISPMRLLKITLIGQKDSFDQCKVAVRPMAYFTARVEPELDLLNPILIKYACL